MVYYAIVDSTVESCTIRTPIVRLIRHYIGHHPEIDEGVKHISDRYRNTFNKIEVHESILRREFVIKLSR